jgi:hypothetical protein
MKNIASRIFTVIGLIIVGVFSLLILCVVVLILIPGYWILTGKKFLDLPVPKWIRDMF